jgi:YesN/AraC family two-component response regulator
MSFTCIIVDDEIHARKVVEKYVQDLPHITLIKSCKNALEAMEVLRTQNIDVMFLDINMPKLSGLNFLESITSPPLVVITTAYREYALEAFELDVIDYLHKPIPFPRFLKAISKVEDKLKVNHLENSFPVVQSNETSQDFIFILIIRKGS